MKKLYFLFFLPIKYVINSNKGMEKAKMLSCMTLVYFFILTYIQILEIK